MRRRHPPRTDDRIEVEYVIDAPPEKVWRAISIPQFREIWWPSDVQAEAEPVAGAQGDTISYRMRDRDPPFLDSVVTFAVRPGPPGQTILQILHRLEALPKAAANNNDLIVMLAA